MKNLNSKRVISIVLIFSVIAFFSSYIIYQIVASGNAKMETEFALKETVYEAIDTQCFVVRDEKFINNDAKGTTVSFVTNGERVAAGDTVSVVFDSIEDASSFLQIQELKKEIEHYEYVSGQANVQTLNIDSLTKKINSELTDYLKSVDGGDYKKAIDKSELFRDSVIGKQIATGTQLDFDDKLKSLKKDLEDLQSENYSYTEIKAEEAGYFISGSDGYENLIKYSDVDNLTNADVEKALKAKPSEISSSTVGRTVSSFNWYIVCLVDTDKTVDLSKDKAIFVNFPSAGIEKLPVSIHKIGNRDADKTLLILSCDEMNESLSEFRIEDVQIITEEYSGFKISNSSIRTVDGEKGVYIVRGNLMGFRKIHVLYSTDTFSIVDNPENSSDYIRLYDNVVTEGVDLYDNKLV